MDGQLRKELKKLEHDYSNDNTLRLGDFYRHHSSEQLPRLPSGREARWRQLAMGTGRRFKGVLLSDWAFLALLGVFVAFLSVFVDGFVSNIQKLQQEAVAISTGDDETSLWLTAISYLLWIIYTTGLVIASAMFVHAVAPQAIGSGIPEMKTIIRGVVLRDYLTFKTLISKTIGVALALGSGVPIGTMGPFVHIASVVANQMSLIAGKFDPVFLSETRRAECLAAACAVGVACTFSSPVGGVLFSIEVTTMYFSVRSYWRGFFAACCGATTIRLLRGFVAQTEVTVNAFFQTSFKPDAFGVQELPLFALLGALCGVIGAGYIRAYRELVLFLRNNSIAKGIFQQHWIVYPLFVALIFSLVSFPHGLGGFTSGRLKFSNNLRDFFANCTFNEPFDSEYGCSDNVSPHWRTMPVIPALLLFLIFHIVFSVVTPTLPVPCGIFMPIFVIGAATGRLMGEIVAMTLPNHFEIYPGVYAVVGAAAFSASVTHSVSVSVMIFEITGQLHFILPVVIAVVVANAVSASFQPSFFDTIIKIKHLPFLPDIPPTKSVVHTTYAEDIMVSPVKAIPRNTTYANLRLLLIDGASIRIFPVIDNESNQMLVGTVSRRYLLELLERQVGDHARKQEAERRVKQAIALIDEHYNIHSKFQLTRAKSESSIDVSEILETERGLEKRAKEAEDASRGGRFLVVPVLPGGVSPRRNAFCSIGSVPSIGTVSIASSEGTLHRNSHHKNSGVVRNYLRQARKYLKMKNTKQEMPEYLPFDLAEDERPCWEKQRLLEPLELDDEDIDPAPFQLTTKTSLFRIHTIFSMLQLAKAYVTDCGRLVGVVTLTDLRQALEKSEIVAEEKPEPPPEDEALRESTSTPQIMDILTPTLEVIRPTAQITLHSRDLESGTVHRRKSMSVRTAPHSVRRRLERQTSLAPTSSRGREEIKDAVEALRRISRS